MIKKILSRLSYRKSLELFVRKPVTVILVVAVITLFFGWQIPLLSFKTSIYDLQIENLPETTRYKAFKKVFGSDEIIRVVVKADDISDRQVFEKLTELSDTASGIDGIRKVISLPEIKMAIDKAGSWSLERFFSVVSDVALFNKNLLSDDNRTTALTLVLENDANQESVIGRVKEMIAASSPDLSIYQIGMPLVSQALAHLTRKDFLRLPPITFVIIAIVLLFLFRTVRLVVLPLTCVTLALVWTFGLMALLGIALSMLTMIVPVFLLAVGTAYCLHIVSEYVACSQEAAEPDEAVLEAFTYVSFPTLLAVTTTIVALGSLLFIRIITIQEFAIFSCIGMCSILIIVLTFLPAVLTLRPLKRHDKVKTNPRFLEIIIEKAIELNLNRQKIVLPLIVAVTCFSLLGILRIRVETNPVGYFKDNIPVKRHFNDIYQDLSGSFPVNVVMAYKEANYFEDSGHVADIARLQKFLEMLPGVDKTISFADYMMLVNYALNQFDAKYYTLPEEGFEVRMVLNNFAVVLGQDMYDRFMTPDMSKANIVLLTHTSSSSDFLKLRETILSHVGQEFSRDLTWEVTGIGMSISASSHHLTSGLIKSLSITMVLIFGIMFVLFLSSKVGLIAILTNIFPIVTIFGTMGWLGIELSMVTSLIASISIGLAVDDTIHYLVRYNKEFQKDLDDRRALRVTLRSVGKPIIFTTLTISIGFSVLVFSSFAPTAVFGILMVITMLSALAGDLILLPSLMQHVEIVTLWDLVRLKLGKEPREQIPLFKGLSRTQIHYIIMAGSLKTVEAGEVLFRKGDPSDSMYTVISGSMDVLDSVTDDESCRLSGKQKLINRIETGEVVGEMGLPRSAPRSATVIASEPVELLQINWKMIKRLQWLYPPTANRFFQNLLATICDRLESTSQCLAELTVLDDATGLCNRDRFLEILDAEIRRSRRFHIPMSVCLLEFEFDSNGSELNYQQTEEALQYLSRHLSASMRDCDTLGRFDSQMLAALMPQTPGHEAEPLYDRMQRSVKEAFLKELGFSVTLFHQLHELDSDKDKDASEIMARLTDSLERGQTRQQDHMRI